MLKVDGLLGRNPAPYQPGMPTTVYALVEIVPDQQATAPKPIDIRWVQDVSGSMHGDKIDHCKQALAATLGQMSGADKLSIASFNQESQIVLEHGSMSGLIRTGKARLAVNSLAAAGGTAISPGYKLGLSGQRDNGVQPTIVLVTDGCSSFAGTDDDELIALARQASVEGFRTVVIGSGEAYNHQLLTAVTNQAPDSELFHIGAPEQVSPVINDVLAELRGVCVFGLKLQGETGPGVTLKRVTVCVPVIRQAQHTDRTFELAAGNLSRYRGQRLLVEMQVQNPRAGEQVLLTVRAAGRLGQVNGQSDSAQSELRVTFADVGAARGTNNEVKNALYLVQAADAARDNRFDLAIELYVLAGRQDLAHEMELNKERYENGEHDAATRGTDTATSRGMTSNYVPTATLPRGGVK